MLFLSGIIREISVFEESQEAEAEHFCVGREILGSRESKLLEP